MVTKVSARNHGGAVRLKAAAAFAESGDIHGIVDELWIGGAGEKKQTLIDTVCEKHRFSPILILTFTGN